MRTARRLLIMLVAPLMALACGAAQAATASRCLAVSDAGPRIHRASLHPVALKPAEVRLTFVGHATFLIESAGGVKIATDYNDARDQSWGEVGYATRVSSFREFIVAATNGEAAFVPEPATWNLLILGTLSIRWLRAVTKVIRLFTGCSFIPMPSPRLVRLQLHG